MEYEPQQFFSENEHDEVKGFTVLEAQDGKYHIAEKWLKPEEGKEDSWMDYWISESDLLPRIERGECEPKAVLSDEQFTGVCRKVGWRYDKGETKAQTA